MYKFVKNNQEKANVFNTVLSVLAIVFTSRLLFDAGYTVMDRIASVAFIFGLLSGLLYIASGYKKNANGYYKGFMIIYALQSVYAVIAKLCHDLAFGLYTPFVIIPAVCMGIAAVCVVILAFVKNLGVSKSLALAAVNFWVSTGGAVLAMILVKGFAARPQLWLPFITIAALAFEFVIEKYVDKEARGTK